MLIKIGITVTPSDDDSFRFQPIDYVEKINVGSDGIKYSELPQIVDRVQEIAKAIKAQLEKHKGGFIGKALPKPKK